MFGVSTTATQPPGGVNKQTGAPLFPTGKALRIPRFKYQPSVFNRSHFPFLTAICPDSRVARHLGPHTGFGRKWNNFDR
jgi:hypothetical protein